MLKLQRTTLIRIPTIIMLGLVLSFYQNCTEFEVQEQQNADIPQSDGLGAGDETPPTPPAPEDPGPVVCNKSQNDSSIEKPRGTYTSVVTPGAVTNPNIQGGLIRVIWSDIEPTPGEFDFSKIEERRALLPQGKSWSLAVHGGWTSIDMSDPDLENADRLPNGELAMAQSMSPNWLQSMDGVEVFEMEFRKITVRMPKIWNPVVQSRLQSMLQAVAANYKQDSSLSLVYVPQMTSNGVEGHYNGVPDNTLLEAAGLDPASNSARQDFEDLFVEASLQVTKVAADAFDNKPIAFEVHDVLSSVNIPKRIMDEFLLDSDFEARVGIGMWWISGRTNYQGELVEIIKAYQGDLYGQVIGKSPEPSRFDAVAGYAGVFTQAKELCMRYIEPWNYEFENNTHNDLMADFNQWAEAAFD